MRRVGGRKKVGRKKEGRKKEDEEGKGGKAGARKRRREGEGP